MNVKQEGGHAFNDGTCQRCRMTYAAFSDQDSPRRGERCAGQVPEARERMFIDEGDSDA